jgi:hypothetical protein
MEEFTSAFHAARCVSTPLVAVRKADPASTTQLLIEALKQGRDLPPLLGWDVVRGLFGIGEEIAEELARVLGDRQPETVGPAEVLSLAQQLCEDERPLYSNAHRFWNDPGVTQGIWDLRDSFKALCHMASGKFISASTPGVYQYGENTPAPRQRVMRELEGPLTVLPPSKSEA